MEKFNSVAANKFNIYYSLILLLLLLSHLVQSRPTLFNYGLDFRDILLSRDSDDISSPELRLRVPITYYGQQYNSIYINQNGLISFDTPISAFANIQFPLDYPSIAPFYSDIDTRIQGSIYYRETQQPEILDSIEQILFENFQAADDFKPKSALIVTWDSVGYFDRKSDKTNTYQLVIASNGQDSFTLFLYDKIEWIQGTGKNPSLPDAKAQAGFISGHGPHFSLRGSGTDQMSNLHKRSNSDTVGLWAFRIGRIQETVEEPDRKVGLDESAELGDSCSIGFTECHSQAQCVDYSPGYCCKCVPGFFGNGRVCLQETIPQRVTGKVKGVLNGLAIDDADLFSYILPGDGRAYTAIAKLPPRLGYDIQTLSIFGTIIGWLFSIQVKGAPNGFQLTGGIFNYTAEVEFMSTGQKTTIHQQYDGLDVFSHLKVDTRVYGHTAVIPQGKTIEVNDYEMQMTRVSPGLIRSSSTHNYRVDGSSTDYPFNIEQTITYEECRASSPVPPELETTKMKVGRNYIAYDVEQEIARYAITSKVTPIDGEDPCKENKDKCGPNSSCVANDDSYKCICNLGFEENYNEHGISECVDIDECRTGTSTCDATAICINVAGSFHCQCRPSYSGDGYTCNKILSCQDVSCGANAKCNEVAVGVPECVCDSGYYGDGIYCVARTGHEIDPGTAPDCRQVSLCHERYATCEYSHSSGSHVCQCRPGYTGDGIRCEPSAEPCNIYNDCHENAVCAPDATGSYFCVCRRGYRGDGYNCQRQGDIPRKQCLANYCWCPAGYTYDDIHDECQVAEETDAESVTYPISNTCDVQPDLCDDHAECISRNGVYDCICQTGYRGDGYQCTRESSCRSHEECGPFGECALDPVTGRFYYCKCRDGFADPNGGLDCRPIRDETRCDPQRNCDSNADCIYSPYESRYTCVCKSGYTGDGFSCTVTEDTSSSCNVLDNCSSDATCEIDQVGGGYRCVCGRKFTGDGYTCTRRSCSDAPWVCDSNADCLPDRESRQMTCQCRSGYQGDGLECRSVLPRDATFLLVAKGMSIFRVPVNGEPPIPLYIEPFQTAIGLDKDCLNDAVYWSDVTGRVIRKGNFDGTMNATEFLDVDIGSPEGIAIDSASKNIYWTDSLKDTVEVANLITKKRKTLINTGLVNPRGIAVYTRRGRLFWSDWNREQPKIEFSGMDGLGRQILVSSGLSLPNSLIVDVYADQLCWADAGNHNIECIGVDGRNRQVIIPVAKYPFGLALGADAYYWTDWNTTEIESSTKGKGGYTNEGLPVLLGGPGKLYGLAIVPPTCAQEHSQCSYSQCQSNQICLPNIRGSRSCRCVDGSAESCVDTF